jgi:predicted membrane channel-forming protein YqfA (hemolysin III family)
MPGVTCHIEPDIALHNVRQRHCFEDIQMRQRARKFIGMVTILVFVCVYALVAMALAQGRITEAGKWVQMAAYVALGLAWILPLLPLIKWMERKDPDPA